MTPDDIQDLFKRSEGEVQPAGGDDDETVLTDEEKQYRIAHLRAVLLEAHNAWVSGSESLDRIAEKLGDGSRLGEFSPFMLQPSSNHGSSWYQQPWKTGWISLLTYAFSTLAVANR